MTDIITLDAPHVTSVPGFLAAGVACGLKPDKLDLAVIYSEKPCIAAALFTTNRVQAAPVVYDRQLVNEGRPVQAVVINSGVANACTGRRGMRDVQQMADLVGRSLDVPSSSVFVMSTGVIGRPLPMDKIAAGISAAADALSPDGGAVAARAIMTTDTHPKEAGVRVRIGGRWVTIAGMCKGAGMIHPNMATMLAMMVTDAAIAPPLLQAALEYATERSFNAITVDGDTSTNDTVLLLANGLAGNSPISDSSSDEYLSFREGVAAVARTLAQAIVRDGEGATKFVTIRITGAPDSEAARRAAKAIANSLLVKTAIYGEDANWGRILCAAGYSGVEFDPYRTSLWMESKSGSLQLVRGGEPYEVDEGRAAAILAEKEVSFHLDLGSGDGEATVWTCDLSHRYVDINAHYRT